MEPDRFLEIVRLEGDLKSTDAARTTTDVTLETLGERVTDGAAADVAEWLPDALSGPLADPTPGEAEEFGLEEFRTRVADRIGVDEDTATTRARAVAAALDEAVDDEALRNAREQLPREFDRVFASGPRASPLEVFDAVRRRADLESVEVAEAATEATLLTLAERLSRGEAADIAVYLPDELGELLVDEATERAETFGLDEFLARVADRIGVDEDAATTRARAVGSVLSELVSDEEFARAREQLPDEFGTVFAAAERSDG